MELDMWLAKAIVVLLALAWFYLQDRAIKRGRTLHNLGVTERDRRTKNHRRAAFYAYLALWCTLVAAFALRLHSGMLRDSASRAVFGIHLPASIALLVCMTVMLFWKTGIRDKFWHRVLGWGVVNLSPIVLATGIALVIGL